MIQFDTIWINAKIFCFASGLDVIEHGLLAAKDGIITYVGSKDAFNHSFDSATVIDCDGLVLTPGFIDCHTHLVYAGNRANEFEWRLEGKTYQEIHQNGGGIFATVEATKAASEQDLFTCSAKRLQALIREGVTTVEIKSGYGLDFESEKKMLSVAKQLGEVLKVDVVKTFLGAHALPKAFESHETYIDHIIDDMLPKLNDLGLVDAVDAFCEGIAFSVEQLQGLFELAKMLDLPVKLHSDQLSNIGGCKLASEFNACSVDHLEFASFDDIALLKEAGTTAVLLPGAFYFLKETQKPPVELLSKANVPMAIATDCNPGSSPTTSLLLMMNMACTLFGFSIEQALFGVTKHAAKALNRTDIGTLELNKKANCALWDIEHPRDLVYTFGYNPCQRVYREGTLIYERQV